MKQEAPGDIEERVGGAGGLGEDEFGSDDFDAVDFAVPSENHPDEIDINVSRLSDDVSRNAVLLYQKKSPLKGGNANDTSRRSSPSNIMEPQTPDTRLKRPKPLPPTFHQSENPITTIPQPHHSHHSSLPDTPTEPAPMKASLETSNDEPPVGFFTARAAESVQAGKTPAIKAPLFNPRLESPSIRKTVGVDHTKTKPVNRDLTEAAAPISTVTPGSILRGNIVDPQSDRSRRIGMPSGTASPLQSRGSYKPPQMKRTGEMGALRDVTAASINTSDKVDAKRQKVMGGISVDASDRTIRT